jgi:hypothetical protein
MNSKFFLRQEFPSKGQFAKHPGRLVHKAQAAARLLPAAIRSGCAQARLKKFKDPYGDWHSTAEERNENIG